MQQLFQTTLISLVEKGKTQSDTGFRYRLHAATGQWLPATYWEGFWMTWILYWASLSSRSEDFAPMDGGLGRACRGATTSDNAAQNYVSWRLRKRWSSGVLLGSRM